ncbi:type I-E CRISPR-associated endoribonuclease Cas2e [Microbacterium trichothecenolyticum]|uniref:CRISPR-associated protein Cas2 n=1 Tax=Microbacterium trichothecenolyticum TaxID=69370 RepID=A0ABU0TW19_MICTR|nr:type I-E CRISPR-associated endoribonuclease Cas2e [Microbacterium trichothecenolyticum]MDQ1123860.1 CRISPR-associated protein Cas2 [Microbacterium trichothecenolyticum]
MVVLVLTACPPGLRGYLTRWLLEISAGVFVGTVSARVRELMWKRTVEMVRSGRAIMVFSARNEQRMSFLVHGHHWEPVDIDGITLMLRPNAATSDDGDGSGGQLTAPSRRTGWSNASRHRRR